MFITLKTSFEFTLVFFWEKIFMQIDTSKLVPNFFYAQALVFAMVTPMNSSIMRAMYLMFNDAPAQELGQEDEVITEVKAKQTAPKSNLVLNI